MKRHRIVIADDDPTIVSLVSLRLELARFAVLSATGGRQAVDLIRRSEPAAVILDVRMPDGDGLSALDALKADPATAALPVMMLSGERDAETVISAMTAGANDYMIKPFHPDRLLERVNRLIRPAVAARAGGLLWEL